VLIYSERKILLADCWWLVCSERKVLLAGGVGEFRKTCHPRNVKFDKVHETCFAGAGNSRFSEAWNL
jgi:hypothetical protein